jgi:hypothetical protein
VLHEQLRLTPALIAFGLAGLVGTSCGIWMLAQVPHNTGLRGDGTESTATRVDH